MRIVSGTYRGRRLLSPDGQATRPTSDRAREAVFNVLRHAKWLETWELDGVTVLDVFAGTGALGLEALSQGATHAVFIDNSRAAARICQENIRAFGEEAHTMVITCDAAHPTPRPAAILPRRLVFLDPPYGKGLGGQALTALAKGGWLGDDAVIVMEMAKKQPEDIPPGFSLCDERSYGVALVRFLRHTPTHQADG